MIYRDPHRDAGNATMLDDHLPHPTLQFRLKAWRTFQRALDPLAPPKPLRQPQRPLPPAD
jgi:hypothetical protein